MKVIQQYRVTGPYNICQGHARYTKLMIKEKIDVRVKKILNANTLLK